MYSGSFALQVILPILSIVGKLDNANHTVKWYYKLIDVMIIKGNRCQLNCANVSVNNPVIQWYLS